jgi:hypothetical protein
MKEWLLAFAVTQAIEVPLYGIFALPRRWAVAFGASLLTHPVVWFVFPRFFPGPYVVMIACAELFAVAVEAAYLKRFGVKRPLQWSLAANAASFGTGVLLQHWQLL